MKIKTIPSRYDTIISSDNGNELRYTIVPEENLKTWQPDPEMKKDIPILRKQAYINRMARATRITVYATFDITLEMLDRLEQSKILTVEHRVNTDQKKYFAIIPHYLFDYTKLNEVLNDLFIKFDL